jgi:hypothetical protein
MKIVVVTSCTGEKKSNTDRGLAKGDFERGNAHVRKREKELDDHVLPAEEMYTGQQHVRLMRGVEAIRESDEHELDLWILSAGYGLIPADREVAPYECTFSDMTKSETRRWGAELNVPEDFRDVLGRSFDLGLVLLGNDYLEACGLDEDIATGGHTLFFCSGSAAEQIREIEKAEPVVLGNQEAGRFSCGLVSLKGELGARVLEQIANGAPSDQFLASGSQVLDALERKDDRSDEKNEDDAEGPEVDYVISIPESWKEQPHREEMKYFIPEWDDRVDIAFDFQTETHSSGRGGWAKDVFAHQIYPEPKYDGILVSRAVAEKTKKKKRRINEMGVHRYMRVPRSFPIMGDCGAFDYRKKEEPPYDTDEMIDYYTRLDYDYGVSIDHLITKASQEDREYRHELTIHNAEEFLREHRARGLSWTPMGAVQGWDPQSYAEAARQIVDMGYDYIAIGGLVRTKTEEIVRVTEKVSESVPASVAIHLFGCARLNAVRRLADLGVHSIDSASALRRAWTGSKANYWTIEGLKYAAVRVPEAGTSFRAKRMVKEGRASEEEVLRMDNACMEVLRAYDRREEDVETVLDTLDEYDHLITPDRDSMRDRYRVVLEDRPWEKCPCKICQENGIEVVIFRGNNRNRRRGFHNTFVFYELFKRALDGEEINQVVAHKVSSDQLHLFSSS